MATAVMEGDDIDTETLQSQIDLSMSLVHDLVSSWVTAGPESRSNAQQELEEMMRRPARLGVGALIPETSTSSRDIARLKKYIINGKKRARDDNVPHGKPSVSSEDEAEESRAGAVRKKTKIDPFAGHKKKAANKVVNGIFIPSDTPTSYQGGPSKSKSDANGSPSKSFLPLSAEQQTISSPRKRKKRRTQSDANRKLSPPTTPPQSNAAKSSTPIAGDGDLLMYNPDESTSAMSVDVSVSLHTSKDAVSPTLLISPSRTRVTLNGKIPLLNLDGPPPDHSGSEDDGELRNMGSPKKKRKRAKKKRRNVMAGILTEPST